MPRRASIADFVVAAVAVAAAFAVRTALAEEPAQPAPSTDFKLVVGFYGAKAEPSATGEVVARAGRVYQFQSNSDEFVVYDRATRSCLLMDLRRKVTTRISAEKLDAATATFRRRLRATVDAKANSADRADRVESRMYRDLIQPDYRLVASPSGRHLELTNTTVSASCDGEPDADAPRLALSLDAMRAFVKLGALRDPEAIPPFTRLDALDALGSRSLRPTQMSFLYRLAGPPVRYRWTYAFQPRLTDRDAIALARLDHFEHAARALTFSEYEAK